MLPTTALLHLCFPFLCSSGKAYYVRAARSDLEQGAGGGAEEAQEQERSLWWDFNLGSWVFAFEREPREDLLIMYGTVGQVRLLGICPGSRSSSSVAHARTGA